jgi:outer membrane protein assembly factor BamB
VAVTGNLVLVGTPRGEILAYDRSGKLSWSAQLAGEVLAPPAADGALIVARTGDGRIYGLNAADGKRRWVYQRSTPALSVRTPTGVLVERGAVFAGFPGGRLVALAADTGAVGWDSVVAIPRGTTELERVADVIGLPVADAQRVCAVAFQGRVACFDPQTGATQWARDISSIAGMAADEKYVFITDDRSAVVALDKASGASLWKQDRMFGRRLTAPLPVGRYVIVGDLQGYVHVLGREDGALAGRIATDDSAIDAPPVALDFSSFIVQTRNGGVYAISLK